MPRAETVESAEEALLVEPHRPGLACYIPGPLMATGDRAPQTPCLVTEERVLNSTALQATQQTELEEHSALLRIELVRRH